MIRIETDKRSYWPGEKITATILLDFRKPIKARGLYAGLWCQEKEKRKTTTYLDAYDYRMEKELGIPRSTHMKTVTREEEETLFEKEVRIAGEGEYTKGEFTLNFTLPRDAKPTSYEYGHDSKIHSWKLKVRLDIAMGLDKNAEKEIFVEGL